MALSRILEQAARLSAAGRSPQDISTSLTVSRFWLDMVMGTDAFRLLVRRFQDESAQGQDATAPSGEGDQSGER